MAKILITDLTYGQTTCSFFLAKAIEIRHRKTGDSFLACVLADRSGELPAVMWDSLTPEILSLTDGDVVKVQLQVGTYQGQRQLTIQRVRRARADEIDEGDYLLRSEKDPEALLQTLQAAVSTMTNANLRDLLQAILTDPTLRPALLQAPGGKRLHHATLGGLLEHITSVMTVCEFLAQHYAGLDRELLLAAAILHDIGKLRELSWERLFDYTNAGRLLGHITLGVSLVEEFLRTMPAFPLAAEVERMIEDAERMLVFAQRICANAF